MSFDLHLSQLQQRILALALLALLLSPFAITLASNFQERALHHEHVATLKRHIATYNTIIEHKKDWSSALQHLYRGNASAGLLPLGNLTATAALLQSRAAAIATRYGGSNVQSSAEIQSGTSEPARYVLTLEFDADIGDIVKVLSDLRLQRPLMVVTHLKLTNHDLPNQAVPEMSGPRILHTEATIDCFMRLSP